MSLLNKNNKKLKTFIILFLILININMASLTQQLEQLKKQQTDLEERIKKEEETKQKLENESSIERLEALVQPLTDVLDQKRASGNSGNVPIWEKSEREKRLEQYKQEMQVYNDRLIIEPRPIHDPHNPPQKNKQLLEEEIYTTIISIFKKQQQEISELREELNKNK